MMSNTWRYMQGIYWKSIKELIRYSSLNKSRKHPSAVSSLASSQAFSRWFCAACWFPAAVDASHLAVESTMMWMRPIQIGMWISFVSTRYAVCRDSWRKIEMPWLRKQQPILRDSWRNRRNKMQMNFLLPLKMSSWIRKAVSNSRLLIVSYVWIQWSTAKWCKEYQPASTCSILDASRSGSRARLKRMSRDVPSATRSWKQQRWKQPKLKIKHNSRQEEASIQRSILSQEVRSWISMVRKATYIWTWTKCITRCSEHPCPAATQGNNLRAQRADKEETWTIWWMSCRIIVEMIYEIK